MGLWDYVAMPLMYSRTVHKEEIHGHSNVIFILTNQMTSYCSIAVERCKCV